MKKTSGRLGKGLTYLLLALGSAAMLLPFLWMISTSLKTDAQIFDTHHLFIPHPVAWGNYIAFWKAGADPGARWWQYPFIRYTFNTLGLTGVQIVGELLSCTMVAYGFARYRFWGRDFLFAVLLATMMLPNAIVLVPQFILYTHLGWIDTYLPLTVPAFFGWSPMFIFLARQFFLTLPAELEEAAKIDGANSWQIFSRIYVPLSKPLIITITVLSFTGHWKDFLAPLVYINSTDKFTLTMGLNWFKQSLAGLGATPYNMLMAATLVVILPIVILFFVAQKAFTEGIAMSGMKE